MDFETVLYTIYVVSMAAGALLFVSWARDPQGVPRWEYLVAAFIPVWSGLAYLALGLGMGTVEAGGHTVHWARYADWVVTTPLLLTALWLTATTDADRKRHAPTLVTLVCADVVMILSGLVADLAPGETTRFVYYGVGVAALVVIFGTVWGPLRRVAEATGPEIGGIYRTVATYLSLFWVGYPATWLLGPSGLGVISERADVALFVLLPIFSKVGYSVLDLSLLRRHASGRTAAGRAAPRAVPAV